MHYSPRKLVHISIGILIVTVGGVYLYHQLDAFLGGPTIQIQQPATHYAVVDESLLTVAGTAEHIDTLTLNGNPIAINQDNVFEETLLLLPGFNILEIVATDRFERSRTETRTVTYNKTPNNTGTTTQHASTTEAQQE